MLTDDLSYCSSLDSTRAASAALEDEMAQHRIVVIDGHIIAQFNQYNTGWWTCSKANNGDESDFAVWEDSRQNRFKAKQLLGGGNVPMVESNLRPSSPRSTRFYGEELRQLARSI